MSRLWQPGCTATQRGCVHEATGGTKKPGCLSARCAGSAQLSPVTCMVIERQFEPDAAALDLIHLLSKYKIDRQTSNSTKIA